MRLLLYAQALLWPMCPSTPSSRPSINDSVYRCLVHTLEWRHSLALSLVKGVGNDGTVTELHLAVRLLLEGQRVLHPVVVVTLRVILTGMGTTGLLAVGSGNGGLSAVMMISFCASGNW